VGDFCRSDGAAVERRTTSSNGRPLHALTYCAQCGGWMRVDVRGAEMWVECESLRSKSGLRLAISAGFHDRRRVELPGGVLVAA
jgi:hypothetical protein